MRGSKAEYAFNEVSRPASRPGDCAVAVHGQRRVAVPDLKGASKAEASGLFSAPISRGCEEAR